MAQITLDLPPEISTFLAASGQSPERTALEAIALEAYRQERITTGQLGRMLGFSTRMETHGFLKEHRVYIHYGPEELEQDIRAGDSMRVPPVA